MHCTVVIAHVPEVYSVAWLILYGREFLVDSRVAILFGGAQGGGSCMAAKLSIVLAGPTGLKHI